MEPDGDTRVGLRERKRQETRTALSWAAIRLTVERGLANVTAMDIAAEAGVSHRTFNNYFSSIPEAIAARQADRAKQTAALLRARPADEPLWEAIVQAVLAQIHHDQQGARDRTPDPGWTQGVRLMMEHPSLQGELIKAHAATEHELAAAVAERTGTDARDLYPRLVAASAWAAVRVAMDQWVNADPPVPFTEVLRESLDRLASGLSQP
jgi:AcrR family transcriptional regulator